MTTHNPTVLPSALRDYADQLEAIRSSLSTMAREAGEYRYIVLRMATNVQSASSVLRAASHVINSMESHKEHEEDKKARADAKAARMGR